MFTCYMYIVYKTLAYGYTQSCGLYTVGTEHHTCTCVNSLALTCMHTCTHGNTCAYSTLAKKVDRGKKERCNPDTIQDSRQNIQKLSLRDTQVPSLENWGDGLKSTCMYISKVIVCARVCACVYTHSSATGGGKVEATCTQRRSEISQFDFCVCVCVCACIMHSYVVYTSRVLLLALQAGRGVYTCR